MSTTTRRIRQKKPATLSIINSNLPPYITISQNGKTFLSGRIQIIDGSAPQWITEEGDILKLDESDTDISFTLQANPSPVATTLNYTVYPSFDGKGGYLPFGLRLDKDTGEIYGDAIQNFINTTDPEPFFEEDRPTWLTTQNPAWNFGEREEINIQLEAESQTETDLVYFVRSGGLPFGIRLDRATGLINGTTADVVTATSNELPIIEPKPRWYTPSGLIIRTSERVDIDFQLNAQPRNGTSLTYFLIDGAMPWGLRLNRETGLISGNTDEVVYPELPVIVDSNAPFITTNTELGTFNIGDSVDIQLESTIYTGRTLDKYVLYPEKESVTALPFGLRFTAEGRIHGTINSANHLGLYMFTIVVYDSVGLRSCNIFSININQQGQ